MQRVLAIFFVLLVTLSLSQSISAAGEKTGTNEASFSVQYTLPYPGMLPDSPFYKLKVLRDRISLALMNDPVKKAEHYLHLADKQMAMILPLLDKGGNDLARQTAYKAEHNMTELTFVYKKTGSKPGKDMYQKIEKATKKHQDVLQNAMKKSSQEDKKAFEQVTNFSKTNWNELQTLYKKKPST